MAPGPPNLGDNRFAPLLSLSPPRKKRNATGYQFEYPELSTSNMDTPKYILLSAVESEKSLINYSCFAVYKSLNAIDKGILSISSLRDGNLLMLVKSQNIADKFMKCTDLPGICKISCKYHLSLNSSKGSIYAPYLIDIPDEEILKELGPQKVIGIHKFKKTIDGISKFTGMILLTFDLYTLPRKLNMAWHVAKVNEYFPNPMRCQTCQRLGHTAKHCKNEAACAVCSLPPHLPERPCTQIQCTNCKLEHEASSRACPKYLELKELLKIKIQKKCTMREAKSFIATNSNTNISNSYSAVLTSNNNNNTTQSINRSTDNTNKTTNNKIVHSFNANANSSDNSKTTTTNTISTKPSHDSRTYTKSSLAEVTQNNNNKSSSISPYSITLLNKTQNSISYNIDTKNDLHTNNSKTNIDSMDIN